MWRLGLTTMAKAPSIVLKDENGKEISLSDYEGSYLVLYTYPKDNTPGCTTEACSFRDNSEAIVKANGVIVGVSGDSVESHQKFKDKHSLNFTLLADPEHKLLKELGSWGEKVSFGQKRMGIIRRTYVFDKTGHLIKVWPKVTPKDHGEEIAAFLLEQQV